MAFRTLIFFLAFSGLGIGSSQAADRVWIGLYLGENGAPPPNASIAPAEMHHRLRAVFGFGHYELIKAQELELRNEREEWFKPRKDFFLRVALSHRQPGEPKLIDYEIYKDGFIVANGKYEPRIGTPLFINGPDFNQGRLIFVLQAR